MAETGQMLETSADAIQALNHGELWELVHDTVHIGLLRSIKW